MDEEKGVIMEETFQEKSDRLKPERETQPANCSHCHFETTDLTNYSRAYGGNVGAHWLCEFCKLTLSASRLGAGSQSDYVVVDVAAMLNHLAKIIRESNHG